MTSESTDSKVAIDRLAPFISELTSRVFEKRENLEHVIQSIASRVGVTPEQVALYTSLLHETLEPTLRLKSVLDQTKSQHIIELGIQPDIKLEVNLGFYEAIFGCEKEIRVSRVEVQSDGDLRPSSKKLKITIPAGVTPGTRLRIAGEGNICAEGEKAGDLYLHLARPLQADGLMRAGDDIVAEIKITAAQSQTGASELEVLQAQLLQRTNGDIALVSRLIEYERRNNPSGLKVDLYRDAIARLERDQSGFI
jgi:hypothetical protein